MGRNFLVLMLLFLVSEAAPDTTGPDVAAVINRVDQFVRYFQSGTNISASDGLKDVMEDKVDVTGFFSILGDLFTNGSIGHFENEKVGEDRFRRLYVNTNRTSVALSEKLAELFKTMNTKHGYDIFDEFWLNRLFPYDRPNEPTLQAIRTAFRGIFSRSKAFYDELSGTTVEQLELKLPFNDGVTEDNRCYVSRLDELCSEWGWTNDFSIFSKTMQSLLRMVGPGCEAEIPEDPYLHSLQLNVDDLARKNNFSGGESNRCFHKFFLRYNGGQYTSEFVHNLAYYLVYERSIYGFCARILQARNNEVLPYESIITRQIAVLRQRILEAACSVSENASPCPTEESSTIASMLLPSEPANRTPLVGKVISRSARDECRPRLSTTTGPKTSSTPSSTQETRDKTSTRVSTTTRPKTSPLKTSTTSSMSTSTASTSTNRASTAASTSPSTQEPNDTRPWTVIARNAAEQAIGDKIFKYPTPNSALESYRPVGMLTIALLKGNDSRDLYEYKVLVFYRAYDDTEYCIRNGTRGDLYSSIHNNVRFLLARYNRTQPANVTVESRITSFVPKIQQAFSEIDTENQCDRLKKIDEKLNGALSEFGAVAVINCARKFVWYELGYRYFHTAWTNSVDIPMERESEYSSKCGNIVVFP